MALLMLFALVAGAGTALSPCVLPILPAVLSAGVTGGRRRPLGVVTGLALSFTFATVGLVCRSSLRRCVRRSSSACRSIRGWDLTEPAASSSQELDGYGAHGTRSAFERIAAGMRTWRPLASGSSASPGASSSTGERTSPRPCGRC
jgi:hypothetical protein